MRTQDFLKKICPMTAAKYAKPFHCKKGIVAKGESIGLLSFHISVNLETIHNPKKVGRFAVYNLFRIFNR